MSGGKALEQPDGICDGRDGLIGTASLEAFVGTFGRNATRQALLNAGFVPTGNLDLVDALTLLPALTCIESIGGLSSITLV